VGGSCSRIHRHEDPSTTTHQPLEYSPARQAVGPPLAIRSARILRTRPHFSWFQYAVHILSSQLGFDESAPWVGDLGSRIRRQFQIVGP
jgi:hypothetical protein